MAFNNPQTGLFSKNDGQPVDQEFFDAAFAGRLHSDPIYKEAYNCNITQLCTMSTWLEEYMGYEYDCNPAYSLIETNSTTEQIKVKTAVTIPTNPSTGVIALDPNSQYVSGNYILPQVGNTLVSPNGVLMDVTAVSFPSANNATVTVKIRDTNAAAVALAVGDELLVLSGQFLGDCECPTGNFSFQDLPIVHDLQMITVGDKGELCGDALLKCQWLKIPFTDECGNVFEKWYTQALQDMYRRFEVKKHFERLFNPSFGIIPVLKARGQNFTTASSNEIVLEDVQNWKAELQQAGIMCDEFAVFCGRDAYQQWQSFLNAQGVTNLSYTPFPEGQCKWIDMEYCGIKIGGLKLHIYEDCSFSNGKMLGGNGSLFPGASIFVPMCNRQTNCRGANDDKMLSTVYFRDNLGRVWDNLTDSDGIFGPRNTYGPGCQSHAWTIQARFVQEVHCPQSWGFSNLP